MKAAKNICNAFLKPVLLLLLIAFQSCSTYNSKTADIESNLFNGDFNQAIASIDQNRFLQKDRNRLLYLMEKGKAEHLNGNYENSNALLEEAYIMIEDRMTKTNAGQAVAAKFTNPMAEPYKGEDFEKVTIHYYKALNYFQLGMPNEALVEAKRINIKLYQLNEKYKENKNKYSEDAFSQILQGILYESTGDINNAFIAYRNAEEIYSRNGDQFFGVSTPEQLKKDLMRTAKQMGFMEEYESYRKKFNYPAETVAASKAKSKKTAQPEKAKEPEVTGEAIVFWENGLAPAKDQIVITASGTDGFFYGTYYDGAIMEEIIIPIPVGFDIGSINAIAIPKYRKRESYYSNAAIEVDGVNRNFELAQDFYPIAKQCLKDRMLRETIDLVARFATKKAASEGLGALGKELFGDTAGDLMKLGGDIAGAATEKADTRNWQTLPATISYTRVPLKEGENKFVISKQGPAGIDTDTLYIPYKKGLQIVNYFDLGRTQLIPAPAAGTITPVAQKADTNNTVKTSFTNKTVDRGISGTLALPAEKINKDTGTVTSQQIIDNYIAALGGSDKLQGVQTLYTKTLTHTTINNEPVTMEVISKSDAANNCFVQTLMNGEPTSTTVVNDKEGYTIINGERIKFDKKTYKSIKSTRTFYEGIQEPLQYNAVLEGITSINGQETYVLKYKNTDTGVNIINYYDTKSGLLIACTAEAQGYATTSHFSDFRDVNGIRFCFKTTSITNDIKSEIITKEMYVNEGVSSADFQ